MWGSRKSGGKPPHSICEDGLELSKTMVVRGLMLVKSNLLVIRMGVAGLTQWGSSWRRERACGRGGIRKNCGNLWKELNVAHARSGFHKCFGMSTMYADVIRRP